MSLNSQEVNICKWEGPWGRCRTALDEPRQRYCILHNTDPDKDPALTTAALNDRLIVEEADPTISMIDLSGVALPAGITFPAKIFEKFIDFSGASILGDVDLRSCIFRGNVNFREADCFGDVNFSSSIFLGEATFYGALFAEAATFKYADFRVRAYFTNCEFQDQADFGSVRFVGGVSFITASFRSKAGFAQSCFRQSSDFSGSVFHDDANFEEVVLGGGDRIESQDSSGSSAGSENIDSSLQRVPFQGVSDFASVQFFSNVNFSKSRVRGTLRFLGTLIPPQESSLGLRFSDCTLDEPQGTRFENTDLSRASFLRTPVSHVAFLGCTWSEKEESVLWPIRLGKRPIFAHRRKAIYDEIALDEGGKAGAASTNELSLVADLFRQLRPSLEADRQEAEAGDFYIGQMEMRRRDPAYGPTYRVLLGIYRVIALYGQSYWHPLIWYALVLTPLFAVFYSASGSESYGNNIFSALTAGALMQDLPDDVIGIERLPLYFNIVADALLLFLTMVTLRRHFSR